MTFEFKKYNKITNTYDQKNLNGVKMAMAIQNIPDIWTVTEKIHGSNFACYVTKENDNFITQFASRNNLLSADEADAFYNFRSIMDHIESKMIVLFGKLGESNEDAPFKSIIVYGELFGGLYEHKEVKKHNQSKVQKGVQYCPDLNFKVIDIFLNRDGVHTTEGGSGYLHPELLYCTCNEIEVDYIKPIFNGTLDECIEFHNDFDSEIYKDYSLPDVGENVCEGVVIKPIHPFYDQRGNRAIFKNKNDKFAEKASQKKRPVKQTKELTDEDKKQMEIANDYVTMPRLNNIESKIGQLEEAKQIGQFIQAFMLDVIEDVKYETGIELDKPARIFISKQAKELIMKKLYSL